MEIFFRIFAFPITLCVATICFFFAMLFEPSFRTDEHGVSVFDRIYRESHNLLLARFWDDFAPWFQAVVAGVVYYIIFF